MDITGNMGIIRANGKRQILAMVRTVVRKVRTVTLHYPLPPQNFIQILILASC
jgi:hypothetical protein